MLLSECLILFWLLPSLITLFILLQLIRYEDGNLNYLDKGKHILNLIMASIVYPFALAAIFQVYIWDALIKERSFKKK